jgi:hypothetical protein
MAAAVAQNIKITKYSPAVLATPAQSEDNKYFKLIFFCFLFLSKAPLYSHFEPKGAK